MSDEGERKVRSISSIDRRTNERKKKKKVTRTKEREKKKGLNFMMATMVSSVEAEVICIK